MDNSFCIYNGEIGKIKKDFLSRILSKPPIFEYVKKVLFWLIFYGFLISMKKFKNRLFVKKRKKYLKCEFQKTCTFEVTCWKLIHNFQVKNRRRFVILPRPSFFGVSKFHEKSWILCIKISILQKSSWKKRLFPNHPYVIRHWFYGFLKKIDFFWNFLFKFTL